MNLIVIAGMPATGKSTLARALWRKFSYPVLEKDTMKERLFDTVGFHDYLEKRKLDHGATDILLYVTEQLIQADQSVIIVNNFDKNEAEKLVRIVETYKPHCVSIILGGDPKALWARYVERDRKGVRHPGHVVQSHYPLSEDEKPYYDMTWDEFEQRFIKRGMADIMLPGLNLAIDTTDLQKVDFNAVVEQAQQLLEGEV